MHLLHPPKPRAEAAKAGYIWAMACIEEHYGLCGGANVPLTLSFYDAREDAFVGQPWNRLPPGIDVGIRKALGLIGGATDRSIR